MDVIIDFWKIKEINRLKESIKESENLIKQADLKLQNIRKDRQPNIKDFMILNHNYGNKNFNRDMIKLCYIRLNFLKNNKNITKEEYYRIGIY